MCRFKVVHRVLIAVMIAAVGVSSAIAATTIGVDSSAAANWRTKAQLEADSEYGTDGYIVYGLNVDDGNYVAPFDTSIGNAQSLVSLPDYISDITLDAAINMWSGNGNFGVIENPANSNTTESTSLLAQGGSNSKTFTISRAAASAFRLTIMVADGDGAGVTYDTTVDDGAGTANQSYTHVANGLAYHVYDIAGGPDDITVSVDSSNDNFHATGFAFDAAGVPPPVMGLEVNTTTGQIALLNSSGSDLNIKGYSIESTEGSLNPSGWSSLQENPAFGNGNPSDGIGWEQLGAGLSTRVGEYNLTDSSIFGPGGTTSVGLGGLFTPGGAETLGFKYTTSDGFILDGDVEYVTGGATADYDNSGTVEQGDLDLVLLNWGSSTVPDGWVNNPPTGPIGATELGLVKTNWGNPAVAPAAQTVPEPATGLLCLLAIGGVLSLVRRSSRRRIAALVAPLAVFTTLASVLFVGSAVHGQTLWSVDIQGGPGTGGGFGQDDPPLTMSGPDPVTNLGNIWNAFEVPAHDQDAAVDPSLTLNDSTGTASAVAFTVTGNVAGWAGDPSMGPNPLTRDYLFTNAGNSDPSFTFTLSGLTSGGMYALYPFSGTNRSIEITVDQTSETAVVGNTGRLFASITANGSGQITGSVGGRGVEENWSGFHLVEGQLTDYIAYLTVDRSSGAMSLTNNSGAPLQMIGYSILSDAGALSPGNWKSIAENYDMDNDKTVDPDDTWTELTDPDSRGDLSEGQLGGPGPQDGATFADGQTIDLGTGAWIRGPFEGVTADLLLDDSTILPLYINFVGNGGEPFKQGDLDFDGDVDVADWNIFKPGFIADTTDLSPAELYQAGDLTGDGLIDLADANAFTAAYDADQGNGAFAAMSAVPEPGSAVLLWGCLIGLVGAIRSASGKHGRN